MLYKINLKSKNRIDSIDITEKIREIVIKANLKEGLAFIYSPHTSSALIINEGFDPNVIYDINNKLSELIPENGNYKHLEGNSDAHIKSSLLGNELFLIIKNGDIFLGKWQKVFFLEFDGPRERELIIKLIKNA